ncbi:MAG: TatD family hydrolase [Anaeroplasma sp.]
MIDTHSHLFEDEFKNDLEQCILRAINNNVNKIILVGFSHETNLKAQFLANCCDIFYPTAGLHPSEATKDFLKDFQKLDEFIRENKVYAIGECGLDYHWDITYKEEQKQLFRLQIELAIKNDLPIIVHMRDATKDTYDILKEYKGKIKGVMHCYSGSYEMAKEFIKLGLHISLGGPVTFKNAKEPKEVASLIPLEYLLIETDCPYLAPVPKRGTRNESSYVKYVCEAIAEIRGLSACEIEQITQKNAERLFNI